MAIKRVSKEKKDKKEKKDNKDKTDKKTTTTTAQTSLGDTDNDKEIRDCGICFEPITTIRGRLSSCDHSFCFPCIEKWSKESNTCPFCKQRFNKISRIPISTSNASKHDKKEVKVEHRDFRPPEEPFPFVLDEDHPFPFPFLFHHHHHGPSIDFLEQSPRMFGTIIDVLNTVRGMMMRNGQLSSDDDDDDDDSDSDEIMYSDSSDEEDDDDVIFQSHTPARRYQRTVPTRLATPLFIDLSREDEGIVTVSPKVAPTPPVSLPSSVPHLVDPILRTDLAPLPLIDLNAYPANHPLYNGNNRPSNTSAAPVNYTSPYSNPPALIPPLQSIPSVPHQNQASSSTRSRLVRKNPKDPRQK